jgi:hypothetical protein
MAGLTKAERKYLKYFMKGWKIEAVGRSGNFAWGGDPLSPVKVGVVCNKLIDKGLLEKISNQIRGTKSIEQYRCKAKNCQNGRIEVYDIEEDDHLDLGECVTCDGLGIISIKNISKKQCL